MVFDMLRYIEYYLHQPSIDCIIFVWQNVFWKFLHSDPYQALSFDRLHASHLGLFKSHIWKALKKELEAAGRLALKEVDDQYGQFTSVIVMTFWYVFIGTDLTFSNFLKSLFGIDHDPYVL